MTRQQYITKVAAQAVAACKGTGLFPSLMIAQWAVESGNGNSSLAKKYNNHFGIKVSKGWKGKTVDMATGEYTPEGKYYVDSSELFRAYDTIEEGFADRVRFLQVNTRYTKAGVFTAITPEEQADAFQKAGYASAPTYAATLKKVVNGSGNLKQYDTKDTVTVTSKGLNLRKGPGSEYLVIQVLIKGSVLDVISERNGWLNVSVGGVTGWVSKAYTTL